MADVAPSLAPFSFEPSPDVSRALAELGRSEDIQFSPDQTRLAIAGFSRQKLLVIEFARSRSGASATSSKCVEITSPCLRFPHGLAWLDDRTIVVANRGGEIAVLEIPPLTKGREKLSIEPAHVLESALPDILKSPGSVACRWLDDDLVEILVCNNFVHTVSRHRLSRRRGWAAVSSEKLYAAGLDVPDSIAIAPGATHVAVSNHSKHRVDVYRGMSASRRAAGKLAGCEYPHGVRFSADGQFILLADAGAPLVRIYRTEDGDWRGWKRPAASVAVMPDEAFERGRKARGEGGPKGIDLTADNRVMVVS